MIALVFSGQGAQKPGMGRELYGRSAAARATYDALESIRPGLIDLCFTAGAEALRDTANAQPAMIALQLALLAEVRARGLRFGAAAGFSLGEWAALAACGMLPEEEVFSLVLRRAEFMADAARVTPGGMAAVLGLPKEDVEELCLAVSPGWAAAANYNAPGQTAVSGDAEGLNALTTRVRQRGGKVLPLKVSGAFHSRAMEPAAAALRDAMRGTRFVPPILSWYPNAVGDRWIGDDPRSLLSRQCAEPVLWEKSVRAMSRDGVSGFLELGPGNVLCGLIGRILPDAVLAAADGAEGLDEAAERLKGAE